MPVPEQTDEPEKNNRSDKVFFAVFMTGIAAISFGIGVFVVLAEVPPYQSMKNAWRVGTALWEQCTKDTNVERFDFRVPEHVEKPVLPSTKPTRPKKTISFIGIPPSWHLMMI